MKPSPITDSHTLDALSAAPAFTPCPTCGLLVCAHVWHETGWQACAPQTCGLGMVHVCAPQGGAS